MTTGKCGCERKPEPGAGRQDETPAHHRVSADQIRTDESNQPKEIAMKAMKFEATCTCGTRVTGNGSKWRHDKQAADKHRAHPVGTLRQI